MDIDVLDERGCKRIHLFMRTPVCLLLEIPCCLSAVRLLFLHRVFEEIEINELNTTPIVRSTFGPRPQLWWC